MLLTELDATAWAVDWACTSSARSASGLHVSPSGPFIAVGGECFPKLKLRMTRQAIKK